ncbi:UNKNOWN [Stylonychia lemnae]|uniref:Tetraspanin family protein n=1 Tax=Stylonychia lemnae TaxID=5949 RepID=A0A078AZ94_STYLE|nr:UNKNOWN [Stylonychia lemnae]|eukprot:CDW86527.1 UNKNOWN [Stylonychia lemnae]
MQIVQKRPKSHMCIRIVLWIVSAIFYCYWGIKIARTDSAYATNYETKIIWVASGFAIYFLIVTAFTFLILKYVKLYEFTKTQISGSESEMHFQFYLHNLIADPDDWSQPQSTLAQKNDELNKMLGIPYRPIYPSASGADNFPQCPGANTYIQLFFDQNLKDTGITVGEGLSYLKAIENDFECADACGESQFYTFSKVSKGPPPKNCTTAIKQTLEKVANVTFWSGIGFGVVSFIGLLFTFYLKCRKKETYFKGNFSGDTSLIQDE